MRLLLILLPNRLMPPGFKAYACAQPCAAKHSKDFAYAAMAMILGTTNRLSKAWLLASLPRNPLVSLEHSSPCVLSIPGELPDWTLLKVFRAWKNFLRCARLRKKLL